MLTASDRVGNEMDVPLVFQDLAVGRGGAREASVELTPLQIQSPVGPGR